MSTKMIILCSKSAPRCYFEIVALSMHRMHICAASGWTVQYFLKILSNNFLFCSSSWNLSSRNCHLFELPICPQLSVFRNKKIHHWWIYDAGIHKIGLNFFKVHVYFWNVEPNLRHQMIIFCSQMAPYYPDIPKSRLILSLIAYTMIYHEVKPNCWQSGECRCKKSFSAPWKWSFSAPKLLLLWSFVTSLVLSVEKFWLHLLVPYEMENFLVLTMPVIFLKSWCNERNPIKPKSGAH